MKLLHCNEYIFVSGGGRAALEKECRDDLNLGFGMGAVAGTLLTKNPLGAGIGSLLGGATAAGMSPECQALAKSKK